MNNDLITAYVDNEITDLNQLRNISYQIQTDKNLKYDYNIQLFCKNIVKERVKHYQAPDYLKNRIINQIKPKEIEDKPKEGILFNLFHKPIFSFATALVIVISIVLILINRTEDLPPSVDISKLNPDNMFYQAINNYSLILEGKLKPQYLSDNPNEILNFFSENGVKYQTIVPNFKEWRLLGAVISDDKGNKLAHHVYTGDKNQIIYVFQVDETYLNNILALDPALLDYLERGNCFSQEIDGRMILLYKIEHNICAVVTNDDFYLVKENFCNYN